MNITRAQHHGQFEIVNTEANSTHIQPLSPHVPQRIEES